MIFYVRKPLMKITISVRNLVEFMLRNGDIDNRRASSMQQNAMQEGSRIHRKIQGMMGSNYHAEVSLKREIEFPKYELTVEGRADGIYTEADNSVVIDEIKGTYRKLNKIKEPDILHLAQAKCYAFIYGEQMQLNSVKIRITYCSLENEEIKYFYDEYTMSELSEWFIDLTEGYSIWTDYEFEWRNICTDSIKSLEFPFPYREGQKELVTYTYQTIYHGRKLFIEAPTGVGKTISTVFPAVKAVGEGLAEKIFYLTAKTITRTVADNTFSLLREHGLQFKSIILTAKEKICFQEEVECNPLACPYAKGHYDRINNALYDIITHEYSFTREKIEEYAYKHSVCPFELGLDISLFSDGIICDYNYLFDPHVYLKSFFSDEGKRDYIFLVDEAHNLLDRGRSMYSATLKKESFLVMKHLVADIDNKMAKDLERCNKELLALKRQCTNYIIDPPIEEFVKKLLRLTSAIEDFLEENEDSDAHQEVLDFYFEVSHFNMIYELLDDKRKMETFLLICLM